MGVVDKKDLGYLGENFQYKLIHTFMEEKEFFKDISGIVDQNMFTDPTLKVFVGVMKEYYEREEAVPSYTMMSIALNQKSHNEIEKETFQAVLQKVANTPSDGVSYIRELAEKFFKQQNIIKKNEIANELIVDALKKSFRRTYFYNKLYEEFHDYFVIEYNANVESQLMLKEFLEKLDLEYNPYRLQLFLESGYNNVCPQERESNLLNKKYKIKNLNELSEFEKIIYGFPIEKEKIIIKK
jgi:hypothetical protein